MRSLISAAARSVKVKATILEGGSPPAEEGYNPPGHRLRLSGTRPGEDAQVASSGVDNLFLIFGEARSKRGWRGRLDHERSIGP